MWGLSLLSLLVITAAPALPHRDEAQGFCIEKVTELASINSGSGNQRGLTDVAKLLRKDFQSLGFSIRWSSRKRSFTAVSKPKAPTKTILLVAHIDTVFDESNPFKKVRLLSRKHSYGPVLSGPGVSDNKGGIALIESLVKLFQDGGLDDSIRWKIFLAADEEVSSRKSRDSLAEFAKGADLALVFEPGWYDFESQSPRIPIRSGGSLLLSFEILGSESHPAMAKDRGKNSNDIALAIGQSLGTLRELHGYFVNLFSVEGKSKSNVTTPATTLKASIRYDKPEDEANILAIAERLQQEYSKAGFQVVLRTKRSWQPQNITSEETLELFNSAAVKTGQAIPIPSTAHARGAGAFLAALGIPTLDAMGPYGEGLHGPDEILYVGSYLERLALLREIVLKTIKKSE